MRFPPSYLHVISLRKIILSFLLAGAADGFLCTQAQAQEQLGSLEASPQAPTVLPPIVGNITFAGTVTLDTNSVNTATMVTGWAGPGPTPSPGSLPNVQSRDGSFAATVNVGDLTLFSAPWTFSSLPPGGITNFWSVDNFRFDLTTSTIVFQQQGFLVVQGTGIARDVNGGFSNTAGTWNFTTQDSAASGQFSFSGATSVPEGSTVALLGMGALSLAGAQLLRRKHKSPLKNDDHQAFSLGSRAGRK